MTPADPRGPLPPDCAVAFKEWYGICEALETGRQTFLIRKGGISEGPGGFRPEHPDFWLFPTYVHQAQQGLKESAARGEDPDESSVTLKSLARVTLVERVDDPRVLDRLDDLHQWTAETIEARFRYKTPGVWVLGVRVYTLRQPHVLPQTPEYAGCKSWVPLGQTLPTEGLTPVADDETFARSLDRLRSRLRGDSAEA